MPVNTHCVILAVCRAQTSKAATHSASDEEDTGIHFLLTALPSYSSAAIESEQLEVSITLHGAVAKYG